MQALTWARSARAYPTGKPLCPAARHVLLLLATYSVTAGVAWPSVETISDALGYTPRHTRRLLRTLEAGHLISVERRPNQASRYTLALDVATVSTEEPEPGSAAPVQAPAPVPDDEMTMPELRKRLRKYLNDCATVDDYRRFYDEAVPKAVAKYDGMKGLGQGDVLRNVVVDHAADAWLGEVSEQDAIARSRRLAAMRKQHGFAVIEVMPMAAERANGDPLSFISAVLKRSRAEAVA